MKPPLLGNPSQPSTDTPLSTWRGDGGEVSAKMHIAETPTNSTLWYLGIGSSSIFLAMVRFKNLCL